MKINKVSLVKKSGQLKQRDKNIVKNNIQQSLFGSKLCSLKSTYTIVENIIERSITLKIQASNFIFYP